MTAAPSSLAWNCEILGTTYFIFDRMPNCSACLVEEVASAPKATLTKTSAPLLPMLSR